jgi:hypothetical protein
MDPLIHTTRDYTSQPSTTHKSMLSSITSCYPSCWSPKGRLRDKVILQPTVNIRHPSAAVTNFSSSLKSSLQSCGFAILWLPLWREGGSLIYFCCWALPTQFVSGLSLGTQNHTLLSQLLRFPEPGGPGARICIPQEQSNPIIPPDTGLNKTLSYSEGRL